MMSIIVACKRDGRKCEQVPGPFFLRFMAWVLKREPPRYCREGVNLREKGRANLECSDRYLEYRE
jgi:hypothetical protein